MIFPTSEITLKKIEHYFLMLKDKPKHIKKFKSLSKNPFQ